MNRIYRWILVAIALGVLSACADMGGSAGTAYEGTAVEPVAMPASAAD